MKQLRIALCACLLLVLGIGNTIQRERETASLISQHIPTIIVDAGHGGEDGGAVSPTGSVESKINLEIALRLEQLLAFYGSPPIMMRETDISLHDATAQTLREKKVSDLKHRVDVIEGISGATVVSIHQNSYPQPKYHGFQVFYAPTEGSEALAKSMRTSLQSIDPTNEREIKQIPDSVYLMNHITATAVLVECGFLTNPQEEQLLQQPNYQTKLAMAITGGLVLQQII